MNREREWANVLDELHGVEATFPEPLTDYAQRLMDTLCVRIIIAPVPTEGGGLDHFCTTQRAPHTS